MAKEVGRVIGNGTRLSWRHHRGRIVLAIVLAGFLALGTVERTWLARHRREQLARAALKAAGGAPASMRAHLVHYAATLLSAPAGTTLNRLQQLAGAPTTAHPVHIPGGPLVLVLFVMAVLGVYWTKEQALERLEADHRLLKQQLLAIAGGWAAVATQADSREAMGRILAAVACHTPVNSAAVYRFTRDDRRHGLALFCRIGPVLPLAMDVPRLFLRAGFGLIGDVFQDRLALYSGDEGERGYLIPGLRHPRVGVFPLRFRDTDWGVLVLYADERGWFYRYRDLFDVVSQEIAILGTAADLAEDARRKALFEELARVRSEILANVSHELRTPLGLVKGYLETLRDAGDRLAASDQAEFLQVAIQETQELEGLIDHLLLMSQLEAADPELEPRWFVFEDWARGVLQAVARDAAARICVHSPSGACVYGDPGQMKTALENLVQNALKYSVGAVDITLCAGDGEHAIRVADRGPGVPPEDLERIFERFYRGPGAARSSVRGSGLGLSIARRIVERHGGRIDAANRPKGGLEVVIRLPDGPPPTPIGSAAEEVQHATR